MAAIKEGIAPESVRRPLAPTVVEKKTKREMEPAYAKNDIDEDKTGDIREPSPVVINSEKFPNSSVNP